MASLTEQEWKALYDAYAKAGVPGLPKVPQNLTCAGGNSGIERLRRSHCQVCKGEQHIHEPVPGSGGLFLAWHRAFLLRHEALLGVTIPYWECSNAGATVIPSQYQQGSLQVLRYKGARTWSNLDIIAAMEVKTLFEFEEKVLVWHNAVHQMLGRNPGGATEAWMATAEGAAADPLFYAFHAEIDRAYWTWLRNLEPPARKKVISDWEHLSELDLPYLGEPPAWAAARVTTPEGSPYPYQYDRDFKPPPADQPNGRAFPVLSQEASRYAEKAFGINALSGQLTSFPVTVEAHGAGEWVIDATSGNRRVPVGTMYVFGEHHGSHRTTLLVVQAAVPALRRSSFSTRRRRQGEQITDQQR